MPRQSRIDIREQSIRFCHGYSATSHVRKRDRREPIFSDDAERLGFIERGVCGEELTENVEP
jgi:hypothetical protein